ncbi:MAG: hypothetical protein M1549_01485 [Candidatus Dependentiae bacterium]|nr:hypothetical protein [Candidatus Dependentiae bacterium]
MNFIRALLALLIITSPFVQASTPTTSAPQQTRTQAGSTPPEGQGSEAEAFSEELEDLEIDGDEAPASFYEQYRTAILATGSALAIATTGLFCYYYRAKLAGLFSRQPAQLTTPAPGRVKAELEKIRKHGVRYYIGKQWRKSRNWVADKYKRFHAEKKQKSTK